MQRTNSARNDTTVTGTNIPATATVGDRDNGILLILLSGSWDLQDGLPSGGEVLSEIRTSTGLREVRFDGSDIADWDSSLLTFVKKIKDVCAPLNIEVDLSALPVGVATLLAPYDPTSESDEILDDAGEGMLNRIGSTSIKVTAEYRDMLTFVGEAALSFLKLLRGKTSFRKVDFLEFLQDTGARALPIVTLINFLIGVILAFIGAVQLQKFGASIYVADLVAIAMVREMSAMMTGMIVAGRSGAAFAAQLGTMMVNEEIDALQTSGFSPYDYLVLPRMLALALMMPLLALYGDFIGILGGGIVSIGILDITVSQYIEQTISAVTIVDFTTGFFKSGVYGVLIAIAGCMRGMQCGRSASAVGSAATSAVVTSIVFIIVSSAILTVLFDILGV